MNLFTRFAKKAARATGHPAGFMVAVLIIVGWALTGPIFKFNNTWQLVINTGTNRDDDCNFLDGLPYPEHAESGWRGDATQTG